jgi:GT2 family glycosyltransferase
VTQPNLERGATLLADDDFPRPTISVIVPTYNRPESLERCLRALAAQTLAPRRFEVIVCDDGTSPPVSIRLAALLVEIGGALQVRVERQANQGPAAARNLGAALARGRYLAFTDDDCEPAADWLERLVARFDQTPDLLIGGGMRNGLSRNPYSTATHAIMDFVYAEYGRRAGLRRVSTSNLSLPAEGFRAIGGFSDDYPDAAGEDYDLCFRWQEAGGQVEYAADAVIVHRHELTLLEYLAQHARYGRGLLRTRRRQRARKSRARVARPGFYVRLVLHPLRRWWNPAAWRCAFLIGASQLATALGGVAERVGPSKRRVGRPVVVTRADEPA